MMKSTAIALAAAIALPLAFGATASEAEAGWKKRGKIVIVVGGGGYGYGCHWMKKKAIHFQSIGKTGKAVYWWNRYYDCKSAFYY